MDCKECHSEENWNVIPTRIAFKHSETKFDLVGQHQAVACRSCHPSLVFSDQKEKTTCNNCHKDVHGATVGSNCARCHSPNSWIVENVSEIHRAGRFPLLGMHAKAECAQCHKSVSELKFETLGINCYDCHQSNYMATQNPNHVKAGFSTDCQQCHDVTSPVWATTKVDHSFFPLVAGHLIANCFECHSHATFKGLSTQCYSCHQKNYNSTTNPNHLASKFPTNCEQCHTTTTWTQATFDHSLTPFALTGAHATAACADCHKVGYNVGQTSSECYSCHQINYNGAKSPDHVAAKIPTACESCHTTKAFQPATFDHATTPFPLTGVHMTVACASCHTAGYHVGQTSSACYSCHQTNYNNTTNPNHVASKIPTTCEDCHTTTAFQPATFNHSTTPFPLTGAHTTVQCASCHTVGYAVGQTSNVCYSCHKTNYNSTINPNHVASKIPTTCDQCHSTTTWQPSTFNHASTPFPLTGAHTTVLCANCHTVGFNAGQTPNDCYSCHKTNYNNTTNPNHVTSKLPTNCEQCHSTNSWQPAKFDHASTPFPLTGTHLTVACGSCHTVGYNVGQTPNDCYSCHKTNYNSTTNPNHVTSKLPTNCEQCHTTNSWQPAKFDHASTPFPLTGAHLTVACGSCHTTGYSVGQTSSECYSCHKSNYNSTTNPNHVVSKLPTTCDQCHNTTSWQPAKFDHASTPFPLTGAHTTVACADCHKTGYNVGQTSNACYSCHQSNYNSTTNPNHVASKLPTTCDQCHNTTAWQPATFNHATTPFPLTGAHTTVACADCHKTGYNVGQTSNACYSCHQSNYNSTTNPNHVASKLPTTCDQCHNTTAWQPATFNHASTPFPLTGAHTTVPCSSCHTAGYNVGQTSGDCYSCHKSNYNSTTNPNHVASGFPTTCDKCHSTTSWSGATFNHSATPFPLTGAHTSVQCASCHTKGYGAGQTPNTCYGCHQSNYNSTTNPNHVASKIPTTCDQCHNTTAWQPSTFNHATTPFPLTGAHTSVACGSCHTVGYSVGQTPNTCYGCHQSTFTGTTNPNHVASGFPTTCETCHSTTNWTSATFNHSTTPFPLTGAHTTVPCASCHTVGYNVGQTSSACNSCHQANYNSTTNPNHAASHIPTTCDQCHNTTAWQPSTFNHSTTPFPLTGAHTTVPCASCHTVGYAVGQTSSLCYSCHQTNYNSTTNPNHASAQFPTACQQCHTTTAWSPSTFNHDGQYFPIYSGKHLGQWTLCSDCHTNASNFAVFSCINCHAHSNKTQVDGNHSGVKEYVYSATSCYTCHPTGSAG